MSFLYSLLTSLSAHTCCVRFCVARRRTYQHHTPISISGVKSLPITFMNNTPTLDNNVLRKYEFVHWLSTSYRIVCKAIGKKHEDVVIKKLPNLFSSTEQTRSVFVEVMILQELYGHENIIKLHNIIRAGDDLYLVYDYMETDLASCIRANILEEVHKQFIIYQLLRALKYMHSANIIHRRISTTNILINSDCTARLDSFYTACTMDMLSPDTHERVLEGVIWRTPPEILCGAMDTKGGDMWRVGCVLGELLLGKPMFPFDRSNQLKRITEIIGYTQEDLDGLNIGPACAARMKFTPSPTSSLSELIPGISEDALDLLQRMLHFNPNKRITPEEAMEHPYVALFHDSTDEPSFSKVPSIDTETYTSEEYATRVYAKLQRKVRENKRFQLSRNTRPEE